MMKRIFVLLLSVLLLTPVLYGCAGKDDPAPPDTAAESAGTGESSALPPDTPPSPPDTEPVPGWKIVTGVTVEDASEDGVTIDGGSTGGDTLREGELYAFYADGNSVYTYEEPWKNQAIVHFADGGESFIDYAFTEGRITVADLDDAGFEYIKYEKGTPEYDAYFEVYDQRHSALAIDRAVKSYTFSGWPRPLEFEPCGKVTDDDLYAYFRWNMVMGYSWGEPADDYAAYQRKDEPHICDIPIEVYEADLQKRFNVTFSSRISENQSEVVPHAIAVYFPQGYGEGGAYVQSASDPVRGENGIYTVDCFIGDYGYQGYIAYNGEQDYCLIPSVTFKLGIRVNGDYSYTYEFCRDMTEHYYTLEDFSSLVPGVSTLDDVRAVAPETVVTDQRRWNGNASPKYIYAGFSKGPEQGDGTIIVVMTPDGVVEAVVEGE